LCNRHPTQLYETLLADCESGPGGARRGPPVPLRRAGMQIHYALSSPPRWDGDDRLSQTSGCPPHARSQWRVACGQRGRMRTTPALGHDRVRATLCGGPIARPDGSSISGSNSKNSPPPPIGDAADEIDVDGGIWRRPCASATPIASSPAGRHIPTGVVDPATRHPVTADIEAANPTCEAATSTAGRATWTKASCGDHVRARWAPNGPIRRLYQIGVVPTQDPELAPDG